MVTDDKVLRAKEERELEEVTSCIPESKMSFISLVANDLQGFACSFQPKKILIIADNYCKEIPLLCDIERDSEIHVVFWWNNLQIENDLIEQCEKKEGVHIHTLKEFPEFLAEIGDKFDFLMLNVNNKMPEEILAFIMVYPSLREDAVLVIRDRVISCYNSPKIGLSYVAANVFMDKLWAGPELYPDLKRRMSVVTKLSEHSIANVDIYCSSVLVPFRLNKRTKQSIPELFVAMYNMEWRSFPSNILLKNCWELVKNKYSTEYMELFEDAVWKALFQCNPYMRAIYDIGQSLLNEFSHVLLFGKGQRGKKLLKLLHEFGISVDGFVTSDNRSNVGLVESMPVYTISEIPFGVNETLIIQSANSLDITRQLKESSFRWINFSENFWENWEKKGDRM